MTDITEHFGRRIARARRAAGINQSELARKIGITRAAVSFWENGHTDKIEGSNLTRLCKILKTSPDYILNGTGTTPTSVIDMRDEAPELQNATQMDEEGILRLLDELTTSQRTLYLLHLRELAELNRRLDRIEEREPVPEPVAPEPVDEAELAERVLHDLLSRIAAKPKT